MFKEIIIFTLIFGFITGDPFPDGIQRSYKFTNDFIQNDFVGGKSLSYRITATIKVASIWRDRTEKLLRFQLVTPRVNVIPYKSRSGNEYITKKSPLDDTKNEYFYAYWDSGKISTIFYTKGENVSLINLKKGLLSLFEYQLYEGEYIEDDISGACKTIYRQKSTLHYTKIKSDCTQNDFHYYSRTDRPLGVHVESVRQTDYKVFPNEIIDELESKESHRITINANRNAGTLFESIVKLKFDGTIENVGVVKDFQNILSETSEESLLSAPESYCSYTKCSIIKKTIKRHMKSLANDKVGTSESALAMARILPVVRMADKEDIIKVLKAKSTQEIKTQLMDIMGAAQTQATHDAVKDTVDFLADYNMEYSERYLQALAVGTRPNDYIILDLMEMMDKQFQEEKIKDTMIQTIASMTCQYASKQSERYANPTVRVVEQFIVDKFSDCNQKELCQLLYIRALHNLKSPQTINLLLDTVINGDKPIAVAAMKALRSYPIRHWTEDVIEHFIEIFHQKFRKFDSTIRTLALDILLELNPNVNELREILDELKEKKCPFEVKQYLIQNVNMLADASTEFREMLQKILANDKQLNNYHVLGQKGLSTALSRDFSKMPPAFNGTLLSVQEISNGVLKRGLVDLSMEADSQKFSVFTLGLYTAGLSSMMGGDTETNTVDDDDSKMNEDNQTPTAGMEIIVQGAYYRPLEFFKGNGELMGHVWSGTASTPTPAYTASTFLHDHLQILRLANGMSIEINVNGVISTNILGSIEISLWNRNAQCQVSVMTGIAVLGTVHLNSMFMTMYSEFMIRFDPKLQLDSTIKFSSDVLLCLKLSQPEVTSVRHEILKRLDIPDTKYYLNNTATLQYTLPQFTYALNKKNNEMCERLDKDGW